MENLETMTESLERARLRELEAEGKYVFHGSGKKIKALEPRQAHDSPVPGEIIPDDQPAIFASTVADVAIFMAIINRTNIPKDVINIRSGFTERGDGSFEFRVTKETFDRLGDAKGYVYVFNKDKFTMRSPGEGVSYESLEPIEIIEVTEKDLPQSIQIKEF